eukprot:21361-Heterococcus_DN1.PRE.7
MHRSANKKAAWLLLQQAIYCCGRTSARASKIATVGLAALCTQLVSNTAIINIMFARLAKIFYILLVLSLSSIHGAHIEGDRAAEAQLHKKLWRGVVRAASTVKNVPKLLAERSRNIKVAHGIPVPPEPVPQRAVRHDDGCYVAGPLWTRLYLKARCVTASIWSMRPVLRALTSQARAMSRSARQAATLLSMVLAGATGA